MQAGRIHRFGSPEVIVIDEIPRPVPGEGEVLVRAAAAGVGPWDALIREKKSVVDLQLPITLGSDLSGIVEVSRARRHRFSPGRRSVRRHQQELLWSICRIRSGVSLHDCSQTPLAQLCSGRRGSGGGGHRLADALRLCAREGRPNGVDPWRRRQCWCLCHAAGQARATAHLRHRRYRRSRLWRQAGRRPGH